MGRFLLLIAGLPAAFTPGLSAGEPSPLLCHTNPEVPFPYPSGGTRRWRICERAIGSDSRITLTARRADAVLDEGRSLSFLGLKVTVDAAGFLEVVSGSSASAESFDLNVSITSREGKAESQTLHVRPAPPPRPICYYSDFGDDVVRMCLDRSSGEYEPLTRCRLATFFRRLQNHGSQRVILWLSPFPYVVDPANYSPQEWDLTETYVQAFFDSPEFLAALERPSSFSHWGWVRELMVLRRMPDLGRLLSDLAIEHEITLAASYRPFEAAVSTYYDLPVFDEHGGHLGRFLPLASPPVNHHPDRVGYAHYRTILTRMGHHEHGEPATLEITGAQEAAAFLARYQSRGDNLEIAVSNVPPLRDDAFVLQRQTDGGFELRPYARLRPQSEAHRRALTGYDIRLDPDGTLRISGLRIPDDCRYVLIGNPSDASEAIDLDVRTPVALRSRSGTLLGRNNVYWVVDITPETSRLTRVASMTSDLEFHNPRDVLRQSQRLVSAGPPRLPLRQRTLVIDRGPAWSSELIDFNQPATRAMIVQELRTILRWPGFKEIFINTRSHTDLAGNLELAYAPRRLADDEAVRSMLEEPRRTEALTTEQPGEWSAPCQTEACPFRWRFARNRTAAEGLGRLLQDLETEFPGRRLQVVIPESDRVIEAIERRFENLSRPDGRVYGPAYYHQVRSSNNYIPSVVEPMAMLDLHGLSAEPVILGVRDLPDWEPFRWFILTAVADLADNRGSSIRSPRSIFCEMHASLTADPPEPAQAARERMICHLLSLRDEIDEVILYESAAWLWRMPIDRPEECGHAYLDRCNE